MPTALITGITGQDGSYLAEQLLDKGYQVYGLVRRLSIPNISNIAGIRDRVTLIDGDLMDQTSLDAAVKTARPDEVYNLAAQSFVGTSFVQPVLTAEITGVGALRMLEAVRRFADRARFYQASSSEMFGNAVEEPQNENTPFHPRSPYGCAKVFAHYAVRNYREAYGMFAATGILFNHESPRRGAEFVTRKVVLGVHRILREMMSGDPGRKITPIELGDMSAKRDWGYAPDYTRLMWLILQHDRPDDFVGATGESHSVEEFVDEAFTTIGINPWRPYVISKFEHMRPAEVYNLRGDASKAKRELGWEPTLRFHDLVTKMVDAGAQS
jgi:GDPmannose 4,6-dehydratase